MKIIISDHSGPTTWFKGILDEKNVDRAFQTLEKAQGRYDIDLTTCNFMKDIHKVDMENLIQEFKDKKLNAIKCGFEGDINNVMSIERLENNQVKFDLTYDSQEFYDNIMIDDEHIKAGFLGNENGQHFTFINNRGSATSLNLIKKMGKLYSGKAKMVKGWEDADWSEFSDILAGTLKKDWEDFAFRTLLNFNKSNNNVLSCWKNFENKEKKERDYSSAELVSLINDFKAGKFPVFSCSDDDSFNMTFEKKNGDIIYEHHLYGENNYEPEITLEHVEHGYDFDDWKNFWVSIGDKGYHEMDLDFLMNIGKSADPTLFDDL